MCTTYHAVLAVLVILVLGMYEQVRYNPRSNFYMKVILL